jgi:hypothetical protein
MTGQYEEQRAMSELSPQPPTHNGRKYLLGLGLGLTPVEFVWLSGIFACGLACLNVYSYSGINNPGLSNFFFYAGLILYVVEIVLMIVFLSVRTVRFIGYGLLTMVLIGPVVAVVGCSVITSATHTAA